MDKSFGRGTARNFYIFPAQVGFNIHFPPGAFLKRLIANTHAKNHYFASAHAGDIANLDYIEALTLVERARHPAFHGDPPPSSAALIYTAFHCYFKTQKYLSLLVAARDNVDMGLVTVKTVKAGATADYKRKREEDVLYSIRLNDYAIRTAESYRHALSCTIDSVRSVIKHRDA